MKSVAMLLSNPFRPDPRVYKEAVSLVQAGYAVTLICWDRLDELISLETLKGINIIRIAIRSKYSSGSQQILFLPRFWLQALSTLRTLQPDIIHCHDLDTAPIGYWFSRNQHVPWIYDAHECYPEQIGPQVNPLIYNFLIYIERYLTPRSSHVITVGERLAQRLKSLGGQVSIVGNYPSLKTSVKDQRISRYSLNIKSDDYVIAYIGGFTLAREILPLIDASRLYPDATILLIGDGPQRTSIETKLPDFPRVKYLGKIPHKEIPLYTRLVDVIYYGLNSNAGNSYYSAPNALFDAMAAAKPVITTNTGEISQIVQKEQCGIVIERPEPDLIARAMEQLSNSEHYKEMATKALHAAKEKYNWDLAQEVLLSVYNHHL